MSKSKTTRTRRKRHQLRQVIKYGKAAAPTHKSKSGRTGKAHSVKLSAARDHHA